MKEIEDFCRLIAKEYTYYLYEYFNIKHGRELNAFPWCCHASANLTASYFSVHFDSSFTHKKLPSHGVAISKDCVVDFTEFQFYLKEEEKKRFKDITQPFTKDEIFDFVQRKPIYEDKESDSFLVTNTFQTDCPLFGVNYAKQTKKDPKTLGEFMDYVERAIKYVGDKVVHNGFY